jgi:hypothetical protein
LHVRRIARAGRRGDDEMTRRKVHRYRFEFRPA